MYCPKCNAEYREGFYRCADCNVDLVDEVPQPIPELVDPGSELVTAFRTGDLGLITLAESILQDRKIPYWVKGNGLQDLFGGGRLGGFNPIVGPAEIQVALKDVETVRQTLRPLVEEHYTAQDAIPIEEDFEPETDDSGEAP